MTLLDDIREDTDIYLDDFGVDAVYTSAVDGLKEIKVLFDKENPTLNPETGEIENAEPELRAKTSDVENARHKDTFEIEGSTYEVIVARPDDAGMTWIGLGKL